MKMLHISVLNKVATYQHRDGDIICGNSNYQIQFVFDGEWDEYPEKTARFIWNGGYYDVDFSGDTCVAPIISGATSVEVGVYAGDLRTTTPAVIFCQRSILCGDEPQRPESAEIYVNEAKVAAERAVEAMAKVEAIAETIPPASVVEETLFISIASVNGEIVSL
jgi:hypothetical protein